MSVTELIKSALPLGAAQGDSNFSNSVGGNGTPFKASSVATPLRLKNSQTPASVVVINQNEAVNNNQPRSKTLPKIPDEFFKDLQQFHERRGTPCTQLPKISGNVVDLHRLYCEVTERGGFAKVNNRDEWEEVLPSLGFKGKCVNASAAIKHIYRRFLDKYERLNFFGEDPDKVDAADVSDSNDGMRSRRFYPSTHSGNNNVNAVPMSYNYRQHIVNMDRRRTYKLSLDLHKSSPYEKLMLSLMSPLPNEQDFAINVCTLMANESKHTLKLNEYPKLLDVLLAHTGVFTDATLRKLFQHVYKEVRNHSLLGFWRDLLHERPQILELCYNETPAAKQNAESSDLDQLKPHALLNDCLDMDFLNLSRGEGTQDYVGQRVQQILSILRNLSFFEENTSVFVKNRTFLRFIVMSANVRWGNIHNQALDIAGNVAADLELLDPTSDDLSRSLMATLCDGIEGMDRAVIINSLEIMYKLCQRDSNEEYINKCLNLKFYQTIILFLSLNDIMLLIYTLETIYALSSLGVRSCHLLMQVRGVIDQLVSLITVEAQSYGPDGCILMRVVETVPGNMLPMVAQNIANLQNVAVIQKQNQQQHVINPQIAAPVQNEQHATLEMQQLSQQPLQQQQQLPQQQQTHASNALPSPSHDDEQYALAWLGATFERASSMDSRVEQQELYRMYLSHCQKFGKHSVVTHTQFPRLVRLIYSNQVGPAMVKRPDGTELTGLYYVAIRLRAQPLPIQGKILQTSQKHLDAKHGKIDNSTSARKLKKKPTNRQPETVQQQPQQPAINDNSMETETTIINAPQDAIKNADTMEVEKSAVPTEPIVAQEANIEPATSTSEDAVMSPSTDASGTAPQPSSSLIKSLLANKVNQRQQKQKELVAATSTPQLSVNDTSAAAATPATAQSAPLKVASASISALVNNPLMQNTALKVGQTTIKPLNSQASMDQKKHLMESVPPPLAPLSGGNAAVTKDNSGRPVIIANQMLVDILDKKAADPPLSTAGHKRKLDESAASVASGGSEAAKRMAVDGGTQVTPSKNAANLYAEMAASILEDEDLEDIPPMANIKQQEHQTLQQQHQQQQPQQQSLMIPAKIQATGMPLQNVQRQLIFQANQTPHLKLTQTGSMTSNSQPIPTAMATIKTDQGIQTVPVILQQKSMEQQQPQLIQQVLQAQAGTQSLQQQPQQQTQYVLATNPQGQTYLVAQQSQASTPPPQQQPTQTLLVTQTPQQQTQGTKTIIILQQNTMPGNQHQQQQQQQIITTGSGQKMLMTTPQGQVLLTQRPQQTMSAQAPQQYFINTQTGAATHIQHVPVSSVGNSMQQTNANMLQRQLIQSVGGASVQQQQQQHQGQISPSLLSQLNHIPATIKLHNPNVQSNVSSAQLSAGTSIQRMGKTVSIMQSTPSQPATVPIQIPQLQQHQSIIQQHIISGPTEKRQVLLGAGRTLEIKETVITQTQPPPQQSHLNSQTIITTQQQPVPTQQSQQPVRAAHPSIIQQKITLPLQQHQAIAPKPSDTAQPMQQTSMKYAPQPQQAAQLILQAPAQATTPSLNKLPAPTQMHLKQIQPMTNQQQNAVKLSIAPRPTTPVGAGTTIDAATNVVAPVAAVTQQPKADVETSAPTSAPTLAPKPPTTQTLQTIDPNWLFICDWRNCPRRKFKSIQDLHHHACLAHCPEHLEAGAEIFCQWGPGPGLCDGIPRKRFSLMTHILDRHLTIDNLRNAAQRRIQTGANNMQPTQPPVTIVRNVEASQRVSTASPALSTSSSSSLPSTTGSSAIHAIKRHTADFVNPKELMDENEGPVTKSIRLTASLILRNLVTYTANAKRSLRRFEPHLANVALSNVESSATISHILYELNN